MLWGANHARLPVAGKRCRQAEHASRLWRMESHRPARPSLTRGRSRGSASPSWVPGPGLRARTSRGSEFRGIGHPWPPAGSQAHRFALRARWVRCARKLSGGVRRADRPSFFKIKAHPYASGEVVSRGCRPRRREEQSSCQSESRAARVRGRHAAPMQGFA